MRPTHYQRCTRCVMDTTDPSIHFDAAGLCSHCQQFDGVTRHSWFPNAEGLRRWEAIAARIRADGAGRSYDCVLGLSGGVDSSYLALKVKDWGLRPLVVHVDAGWNSELAVANIECIVRHGGFDLHTHVVEWEDMRNLQLAFLRAGVANQDVPQDHVFFAALYRFAVRHKIGYVLSGGNTATEGISASAWHASAMDAINLLAIQRRFGSGPMRSYPTVSFFDYYLWLPFVKRMRVVRPLNFMPFDQASAIAELEAIGWRSYGRKHGESLFTKLFQNYYLPRKFGYDKRLPHLSSLIVSGQMTREDALRRLVEPLYAQDELEIDIAYFCKKLRLTREEFDDLLQVPNRVHTDFPNWGGRQRLAKRAQRLVERLLGRPLKLYS